MTTLLIASTIAPSIGTIPAPSIKSDLALSIKKALALLLVQVLAVVSPCVQTVSANPSDTLGASIGQPLPRITSAGFQRPDFTLEASSERRSLLEPTLFVMAFHMVGMGMLVSMDPEETGFQPVHIRNWAGGFQSSPIWDDDSWITNFILHPAWGSETYLQARGAGYRPLEAFLFSTAASILWEYGFESWAEHPSRQDLLVTSTVGSILGELRFVARQALIRQKSGWADIVLVLLDPFRLIVQLSSAVVRSMGTQLASVFEPSRQISAPRHIVAPTAGLQITIPL